MAAENWTQPPVTDEPGQKKRKRKQPFKSLAEDEQTLEANKPKKTEPSTINEVCHTLLSCLEACK